LNSDAAGVAAQFNLCALYIDIGIDQFVDENGQR